MPELTNTYKRKMVQYGVWPNCNNACKYCLRKERDPISLSRMLYMLDCIKKNIKYVDFKNEYSSGISLLGGELYYIKNKQIQESFLDLITVIANDVIKVSNNPYVRFSTVSNGIYSPEYLFRCFDLFDSLCGISYADINFSYDIKYRFSSESNRLRCLKTINEFRDRYSYRVGVQMILTQYLIDAVLNNTFNISNFMKNDIPGCNFAFLYPHKIHTGYTLNDFNFSRKSFLTFLKKLRDENPIVYFNFTQSTKNSSTFKYSGLFHRSDPIIDVTQQPVLSDGKEIMTDCGHSILYRCYSDSTACMFCDIQSFDGEI